MSHGSQKEDKHFCHNQPKEDKHFATFRSVLAQRVSISLEFVNWRVWFKYLLKTAEVTSGSSLEANTQGNQIRGHSRTLEAENDRKG